MVVIKNNHLKTKEINRKYTSSRIIPAFVDEVHQDSAHSVQKSSQHTFEYLISARIIWFGHFESHPCEKCAKAKLGYLGRFGRRPSPKLVVRFWQRSNFENQIAETSQSKASENIWDARGRFHGIPGGGAHGIPSWVPMGLRTLGPWGPLGPIAL